MVNDKGGSEQRNRTRAEKIRNESSGAGSVRRRNIERLIDEIVEQSFPASDPPAWGVVSALLEQGDDGSGGRRAPGPP